jgi:hypothetical protein
MSRKRERRSLRRRSAFASVTMMVIVGLLAGALGGLGVGLISKKGAAANAATSATR